MVYMVIGLRRQLLRLRLKRRGGRGGVEYVLREGPAVAVAAAGDKAPDKFDGLCWWARGLGEVRA